MKSLELFSKNRAMKDGYQNWCKNCKKKQYYTQVNRILERKKQWYQENKSIIVPKQSSYLSKKRRNDIQYNLYHRLSRQIRGALKIQKAGRKWEIIVGYSVQQLKSHLESQFKPGMNWNNYGKWHIDHIKPKCLFSADEVKQCWALSNLQPLWAEENIRKGINY